MRTRNGQRGILHSGLSKTRLKKRTLALELIDKAENRRGDKATARIVVQPGQNHWETADDEAIALEAQSVQNLTNNINQDFVGVVHEILNLKGRVIVTGIGKSAIIAQKIVATLNSTGTPSIFLHAADAIHGDLGIVQPQDLIIALSKSGNTPEIKVLVPFLKQTQNKLVAIVGNIESFWLNMQDYILDTTVEREACPNNLAPTTSTTAQLAMGDALAVVLQECREFSDRDFARYHPGGALGKQLYLKVSDLSDQNGKPEVDPEASVRQIIITITQFRLGAQP
ncbi:hypothetical protein FQR65_LT17941 [Abscondita terminalis]|nr:hypothetical protein FQR65_LT17941 [Abscondita terminalis]